MIKLQLHVICLITSIFFLFITIKFIKSKKLNYKYSFIWLVTSNMLVVVSIFPDLLNYIAMLMGVVTPVNAMGAILLYFIIFLLFALTVIVSKQDNKIRILCQKIALLEDKL